ncbi:MAG: gliding motility-associated C-terminal domain-containing protein [Saprospiraceae bacterium]|nr:gliding motility-associated C-terminal domain-containing protein [Lewinella sp.]
MLRIGLRLLIAAVLGIGYQPLLGQNAIHLDECDFPYVDPQKGGQDNGQNRDTLIYESYFTELNQVRAFYIDINAFGGQQTDRARVFAILPDSSLKEMGSLEFGSCADCVEGFAFVDEGELQVSGVPDEATMNMWLESYGQPGYQLPGNLQTLAGVGRISGTMPACAIGLYVEYSVYSNPNTASTEFATYIHCPVILGDCAPQLSSQLDCQTDSLYLQASIDPACIAPGAAVRWYDHKGWSSDGQQATRRLSGNLGMYYFEISDECCTIVDSILIENPPFAMAGPDITHCMGDVVQLNGSGGMDQFWEFNGNPIGNGNELNIASAQSTDAGHYIFHAFDAEGCEDTDTLQLVVNIPLEPQLTSNTPCFGDTLYLELSNISDFFSYTWSHPTGTTLAQDQIIDFQPTDVGNYTFDAVDTNNCPVQVSFLIEGAPLPDFEYIIEPNCDSTRVYLFPADYTYTWSDGQIGDQIASAEGGDFQLSITDAVGCRTVTDISVPAPEGPVFELVLEKAACPGEGASLLVQMADPDLPVIFSIDAGQTYGFSPEFQGLSPGKYQVRVQDELGCVQAQTLIIPAPDTMGVSLPFDRLDVRPNTPISLQAETIGQIVAYQWVPDIIDTGGPATEFTATQNMDIRLVVEDAQGCRAVAAVPLTIVLGDIYVPDVFSPNGDGVNDGFTFFSDLGSGEVIEYLHIFDRNGGLIFSTDNLPLNEERLGWDGRRAGRDMPQGIYVYHGAIRFGNGFLLQKKGSVTLVR